MEVTIWGSHGFSLGLATASSDWLPLAVVCLNLLLSTVCLCLLRLAPVCCGWLLFVPSAPVFLFDVVLPFVLLAEDWM